MPAEAIRAYRRMVENQVAQTNAPGDRAACALLARLRPLEAARDHAAFVASRCRTHRLKRSFIAVLDAHAAAETAAGG